MFRMPQYLREVLAANEYATARDMAVAADRIWDLRQSAPAAPAYRPRERSALPRQRSRNSNRDSDRGCNSDRAPTAAAHRASAADELRHLTIRNPNDGTCC